MEQLSLQRPSWRDKFRDGLLAALFAASVITILEYSGFNAEVNAEALRIAFSVVSQQEAADTATAFATDPAMPTVVVLRQGIFEKHFHQTSPLDRCKLAQVIDLLINGDIRPAQLVVDFDLSPSPSPSGRSACEESLYWTLERFVAGSGRVVLTTPAPVLTPEAKKIKREWMEQMCSSGIHFGLPYLYSHQGVVMKHSLAPQALGNVAHRSGAKTSLICKRVFQQEDNLPFLTRHGERPQGSELKPYNTGFFRSYVPFEVDSFDGLKESWRPTAKTIFLGGSYGRDDWYVTPGGKLPGVAMHAAGYYSATKPVDTLSLMWSLVVGVVFALLGGYLLMGVKHITASYWLVSVIAPLVLPIFLLILLSLLLALLLTWNIAFSVAMVTEGAVLFSEFYPSLKSEERSAQGRCCIFFDSYISLLAFVIVVVTALALAMIYK